jgi:thermitase
MHRISRCTLLACALFAVAVPASASAATGQVLVKFKSSASSALKSDLLAGANVTGKVQRIGVTVATSSNAAALVQRLNRSRHVVYAELDQVMRASAIPNDAQFGALYGMHNTGQTGGTPDADIDAPEGWDLAGAAVNYKIGIVDTGIRSTHQDLSGKVVNCAATTAGFLGLFGGDPVPQESRGCADDNGHGTHVAGTIAAKANNGVGVAGVSYNSPLGICKALHGPAGAGSTAGVANCIVYLADRGNKVISMSLGGGNSSTLQNAVNYAVNTRDALLIAAAGNDGNSTLNYPAGYANVVSVAATDDNDSRASFSNANSDVEIAAPGVDILSTWSSNDSSYNTISGTSMATPHVSGVAGVIRARNPTFTWSQARSKLQTSVDDKGAAGRDAQFGFGRVNLVKAAS